MEHASLRLSGILAQAESHAVDPARLATTRKLLHRSTRGQAELFCFLAGVASVTLALGCALQLYTHAGLAHAILKWQGYDVYRERCALNTPERLMNWVRPAEDCELCRDLQQVDVVADISPKQFEDKYAYTGRPVVVSDGTQTWPAKQTFSYQFFRDIYKDGLEQAACQFFPYETEFQSLREVFNMSEDRAEMRDGTKPWYIGWSNCDNQVARVLKKQYSRPYFLPETSENKKLDWIFMGSPGYGAKMHVDSVSHPSWQAQLRGSKKWTLQPPSECIYQCKTLEVVVKPGEIIVLDTNRWYHQTMILPGEMSITIGAEFD